MFLFTSSRYSSLIPIIFDTPHTFVFLNSFYTKLCIVTLKFVYVKKNMFIKYTYILYKCVIVQAIKFKKCIYFPKNTNNSYTLRVKVVAQAVVI